MCFPCRIQKDRRLKNRKVYHLLHKDITSILLFAYKIKGKILLPKNNFNFKDKGMKVSGFELKNQTFQALLRFAS